MGSLRDLHARLHFLSLCLQTAVEGSVHVLREGVKAGIKKAVVTSSTGTFDVTNDGPFGPDGA